MIVHHIIASLNEDTGGPAFNVSALHQSLRSCGVDSNVHSIDYRRHGACLIGNENFPVATWITQLSRGWSPAFSRRVDDSLRRSPGLIHNHGCWMMPNVLSRVAAQRHKLPLLISPRGMLESWSLSHSALKKRWAWRLYERENLRSAHAFHATSMSEAESIRKLGFKQDIYFVPNGVSIPEETFETADDELAVLQSRPFILFLSRIHQKKGIEMLLNAWEQLQGLGRHDWSLVVAGPDLDGYGKRVMDSHRLKSDTRSVLWLGPVGGSQKSWLLRNARFLVLPSYSENFGQVVAESLAHGRPVLTTDRTPWLELPARGCGWIVPPDTKQLMGMLQVAMGTPAKELELMGKQGRAWMKSEFAWDRIASAMTEAYAHLSGNGPRPNFCLRI